MNKEEAIKVVRENYPHVEFSGSEFETALRELIPEFSWSEDEVTRRFLMAHMTEWIGITEHDLALSSKDVDMEEELAMFKRGLAYLEKQKEFPFVKDVVLGLPGLYYYDGERMHFQGDPATKENPYDFAMSQQEDQKPKFYPGDVIKCTSTGSLWVRCKYGDNIRSDGHTACIGGGFELASKEEAVQFFQELNENGYQWDCIEGRPIKKEQKLDLEFIQRSWYMDGYIDGEFKREPRWNLKAGKGGPKYEKNEKYGQPLEQKPAEWGEDDETIISAIEIALCTSKAVTFNPDFNVRDWLKSLHPQPKQEWNKEDEMYLSQAIEVLEHENYLILADKLKSLRSKPKQVDVSDQTLQLLICYLYGCHDVAKRDEEKADCRRYISYLEDLDYTLKNKWKPSEEDLDAIKELIDDANKRGWVTPGATRLYEQLKAL